MTQKLKCLKWWDIVILTLIFFGQAIYSSTVMFFQNNGQVIPELTETTGSQNVYMMIVQGLTLVVAAAYLIWRKFDFKQWQFKFSPKATLTGIGMFFLLAIMVDIFVIFFDPHSVGKIFGSSWQFLDGIKFFLSQFTNLPLVAYALLNGFYEEIYFIALCTAVEAKHRTWIFLFSILIRISFHTYQGLVSALSIGIVLGIFYYIWYRKKSRNLYPIMLSHSIADVVGLTILQYIVVTGI